MPAPQLSDSLWSILEPLLPPPRPRPKGGRPPISARAALTGTLFVLRSGIPGGVSDDVETAVGGVSGLSTMLRSGGEIKWQ